MISGRAAALALGTFLLLIRAQAPAPALAPGPAAARIGYFALDEAARDAGVHLLTASSIDRKGHATGAIRYRTADGWNASCGATFVSPQYAITAAHCVASEHLTLNHTRFTIEQYDTTRLDAAAVRAQAQVDGAWPDFHRPRRLDADDGYRVQRFEDCTVAQRDDDADIALIRCPARAINGSAEWVRVASVDDGSGPVEVRWFFELLNLSMNGTDAPDQPRDNWFHYGMFTSPEQRQNYHYFHTAADQDHQLLPLRSTHSAGGEAYRRTGAFGNPTIRFTNVPVCHGTSGSGVFIAGTDDFLGPITAGRYTRMLCDRLNDPQPSPMASGYPQLAHSARLEGLPEVRRDRLSWKTH